MFEIGKWYSITMTEGGSEGRGTYQVLAYEHPLLKLRQVYSGEQIVNVTAPNFVGADLNDDQEEPKPLLLELPEWTKEGSS